MALVLGKDDGLADAVAARRLDARSIRSCSTVSTVLALKMNLFSFSDGMKVGRASSSAKSSS